MQRVVANSLNWRKENMKLNFVSLSAIGLALSMIPGLQACSHVNVDKLPKGADPNEEISRLELDQKDAYYRQLNVLAPNYYEKADRALKEAKESRTQGKDNEDILKKIEEGHAY